MIRRLIDRAVSKVRPKTPDWLIQNKCLAILLFAAILSWPLPSFAMMAGFLLAKDRIGSSSWYASLAISVAVLFAPVAFAYVATGSLGLPTVFHLSPLQPNTGEQAVWNGMWGTLLNISLLILVGYLGGLAWSTNDPRRAWLLGAVCVFVMLGNGAVVGSIVGNVTANQVYVQTWTEAGTVFGDQWREQRKIEEQDADASFSKASMMTFLHSLKHLDPKTADLMIEVMQKTSTKP